MLLLPVPAGNRGSGDGKNSKDAKAMKSQINSVFRNLRSGIAVISFVWLTWLIQ
jgi:hypothetical protein